MRKICTFSKEDGRSSLCLNEDIDCNVCPWRFEKWKNDEWWDPPV